MADRDAIQGATSPLLTRAAAAAVAAVCWKSSDVGCYLRGRAIFILLAKETNK